MELLNTYDNEDSQSSSSLDDEPNIKTEPHPSPKINFSTEKPKTKKVCGYDPLGKVSLDELMNTKAKLRAEKTKRRREETLTPALNELSSSIQKEILRYLGSIKPVEKQTILGSMDRLISIFTKDHQKFNKPGIADFFADFLRHRLHSYNYLFRSHERGKRYYKRITRILAIYTDLELYASLRGNEYDRNVADRLVFTYQFYLDDNLLVLDILLHSKRLCRLHRGILVLIFEHFLVPKTSNEYSDTIFMKYLCLYKKWIYIEEVNCQKIRDLFIKFIKPRKTLCMNSLFKPYLPVDGEGFVTVDNIDDILNKEHSHTNLARCIRKSEETPSAAGQVGEVIVLTDDEPDYDSVSNPGTSSMAGSHPDDMSSDFDCNSASSMNGIPGSSTSQNVIETVLIESPASLRKSSTDSFEDFEWNANEMNKSSATVVTANSNDAQHQNDEQTTSMEIAIKNDKSKPKLNGDTSENLSTLDDSLFDRLVNDINSTHLSLPSNPSNGSGRSSNVDVIQNGNRSQTDDDDNDNDTDQRETHRNDILSENGKKNQVPVVCDVLDNLNKVTVNACTEVYAMMNGETELIDGHHQSNQQAATIEMCAGHLNADEMLNKNCDNEVNTILKGHEETLKNIAEIILTDDLKMHRTAIPTVSGSSTENPNQNIQIIAQKTYVDTACSPLIFENEEKVADKKEETVKESIVESIVDKPSIDVAIGEAHNNEITVDTCCELIEMPVVEPTESGSLIDSLPVVIDEAPELIEPIEAPDPVKTVNEPPIESVVDNVRPIETVIINDTPFEIDVIEMVSKEPNDWLPAAESTVSILAETSLLTKSEQEILFKDRDSGEIFSELFTNGPTSIKDCAIEKTSDDTLSPISSDSPLAFLVNGIDPNFKLKTYSRKNRKLKLDTKTISTQTHATQMCGPTRSTHNSPVTTIDDSMKTDKEILIDDDEQFLSDIFNSMDSQMATGNNVSKSHSPKTYLASTPAPKPLRTYAAKRPATLVTTPVNSMTPKMDGIVYTIKPIEKSADDDSKRFEEKFDHSPWMVPIRNEKCTTETPPVPIKRPRGRPRKYPLSTPAAIVIQKQTAVKPPPKKDSKKRGRKPKPIEPLPESAATGESMIEPKVLRPRRLKAKRISIFRDVLKMSAPKLRRLTMSRRFSKVFGDRPQLATILRRLTYNKSINSGHRSFNSRNCDSILGSSSNSSSILYSSAYRLNGQKKATDSPLATNKQTTTTTTTTTATVQTTIEPNGINDGTVFTTPSNPITISIKPTRPTILERKNYLKSNQTASPMASTLKFSPHSAKQNHSSPQRIRHINRIQRYSRIDLITNLVRRRDRKKSVKNTNPRVLIRRIDLNSFRNLNVSAIPKPMVENKCETNAQATATETATAIATDPHTNDVQNSTALVVDLTDDDEMQLSVFGPAMNSTRDASELNSMHSNKRTCSPSFDTETDITNEFTTDQESNVEDGDDSTRKSKRSRKRPKILDL